MTQLPNHSTRRFPGFGLRLNFKRLNRILSTQLFAATIRLRRRNVRPRMSFRQTRLTFNMIGVVYLNYHVALLIA